MRTTWDYIQSEPSCWTVGFYSPDGKWNSDSDHSSKKEASERVHYLNGGQMTPGEMNLSYKEAAERRYQDIVHTAFKELKNSVENCDFDEYVDIDLDHNRR